MTEEEMAHARHRHAGRRSRHRASRWPRLLRRFGIILGSLAGGTAACSRCCSASLFGVERLPLALARLVHRRLRRC